jgi:hypothetical protein
MKDDIKSKLQDVSPDDQVELASWLVNRIATLSQTYRETFFSGLNPDAVSIFERTHA